MKQLTRCGALAAATIASAALFAFPATATSSETPRTHNCVNAPEWNRMDAIGPKNNASRAAIEKAWDARPIGARNEFYLPTNTKRWYSLAYRACGTDRYMKVVVLYRVTSETWQYSLKGEFVRGAQEARANLATR